VGGGHGVQPPYKVELKRGERRHLLLDFEDAVDAKGTKATRLTFRD
jgi:hypothetical protein